MARNDDNNRSSDSRGHSTQNRKTADRDRRRDRVVNTVKERPYTAAALATVAAGAAAFFLTRGKSDKPLMNWGQDSKGDNLKGAGAYKQQGSTTSRRSLETTSTSPSSSAGTGAGTGGTSPSAVQAASLSATGSSTNASATGGTSASGSRDNRNTGTSNTAGAGVSGGSNASGGGKTSAKAGDTGLDETAKTETKVGAVSYGA
jgi:hypothetical protein